MNILITGAGGFVGQQVLKSLLQTGNNISLVLRTGADITHYKNEPNIKNIISTPNIFTENQQWWMDALQKIELVIHIAWYTEPGKYLQSEKNLECLIDEVLDEKLKSLDEVLDVSLLKSGHSLWLTTTKYDSRSILIRCDGLIWTVFDSHGCDDKGIPNGSGNAF